MAEKNLFKSRISRRDLMFLGACGVCTICLAGIAGCDIFREQERTADPDLAASDISEKGLIRAKPSPWFSKPEDGIVRCQLCPRLCLLKEGERGYCRVRENRGGIGHTLVYGNPVLVQKDPVERKPFFHVLPGSRALSISTAGCNLACKFCEVWDIALVNPEEVFAYDLSPGKVIEHALASRVSSVSYAFGEPVVFFEFMEAIAEKAREKGLLNLVHTAGYIQPEPLQKIAALIDAVNFDLKGFDPHFYREYVGGELDFVLESLKLLRQTGIHLEITAILIPTLNDSSELIEAMCNWIASKLGKDVPIHFARFYPLYRLSALPRTPVSTLEKARNLALKAGLQHVYIAKVPGHEGENSYCAGCGEMIIKRVGFVIEETRLDQGSCRFCGTALPGIWS